MALGRQLSFLPLAYGNTATDRGHTCTLWLALHTQLSAPDSWKNVGPKDLAVTYLHLTHQSPVWQCQDDISRLVKIPRVNLGGKYKGERNVLCA